MAEVQQQRRPFHGSCHCGAVRYLVFLNIPHQAPKDKGKEQQNIYRCNCTACHKTGIFHVRVHSSPDDFLLLSPQDPMSELGNYKCGAYLNFFFCKTCAVRPFTFMGEGEVIEVDLSSLGVSGAEPGVKTKAWRPKKEGWIEGRTTHGCYLSVNGYTVDAGQEGFDLREWSEKKLVGYEDYLRSDSDRQPMSWERPYPGGAY
ncbi:DUF636 domain-containing protein [Stachybotrys elegans]|uniref:DUF636 domain-containing protein n=1 Tax=Stachybotrys elegans TaxID=80388 RepID=A0A8K0SGN4_9HYPO|nr:DUF636 domain-containing protein [Stachybotrys elegans]